MNTPDNATNSERKVKPPKKGRKYRQVPADEYLTFFGKVHSGPTHGPGGHEVTPRKLEGADGTHSIN